MLKADMVNQIRDQVVEVIDSGSYEIKRQFIQACVKQIKIAGNSVTIRCFIAINSNVRVPAGTEYYSSPAMM